MRAFLKKHGHVITNFFLIVCLGHYGYDQAVHTLKAGRFDFAEVAFALHNLVMLTFILIRKQHRALNQNVSEQAIALVAFFSGILFSEAKTDNPLLLSLSQGVIVFSMGLGILSFLSLGRSFGILIALREVKTGGLYKFIRHPMYFTDILWRVGMVLKNPCTVNLVIFVVSSACYVYRAMLEERFLGLQPEYREYMQKVRYRFIPLVY